MGISIRQAKDSDNDWLVVQLELFSKFNNSTKSIYSEKYASGYVDHMINNDLCLIAERENGLRVGFVAGMFTPCLYNPDIKMLTETFWWVDPAHRSSRAGLMLLNAFTDNGKEIADWIVFTLESHSPVNEKTLTKRGYRLKEKQYLMEVSA